MIRFVDLRKMYGSMVAVDGISLDIAPGEVFGFIGPNGAGKTTSIRMMVGLLAPTSGTVLLGGHDIGREPERAKAITGYLADHPFHVVAPGHGPIALTCSHRDRLDIGRDLVVGDRPQQRVEHQLVLGLPQLTGFPIDESVAAEILSIHRIDGSHELDTRRRLRVERYLRALEAFLGELYEPLVEAPDLLDGRVGVRRLRRTAAELHRGVGVEVAVAAAHRAERHVHVERQRARPDARQRGLRKGAVCGRGVTLGQRGRHAPIVSRQE